MSVVFVPLFPWPYLAALAICIAAVGLYGMFRQVRGALLRMAALGLGILALANPTIVREQRAPLSDVLPVVVDESPSQAIGQRTEQTQAALEKLRAELAQLPNLDVRIVHAGNDPADPAGGTRLFGALDGALADVPTDRLAGVVMITDGEVHDAPGAAETKARVSAPLHVLLSGSPDEGDRRLMVVRAPRFGIIGEPVTLTVRVDDFGPGPPTDTPALLTVTVNGQDQDAAPGETVETLLERLGLAAQYALVERNGEPVERARYGDTALADGDRLVVARPVAGG
jgi:thiamine biosynthesis protein ThiS